MFSRCYSLAYQRRQPTYVGCTVDPAWHKLSDFKVWFDENYRPGYQLDKDILVPGNKVYGPDTCVFVPQRLNLTVSVAPDPNRQLPLGVRGARAWVRGEVRAQTRRNIPDSRSSGRCV